ncbi:UNVERIFIED_CONTAM: hypothetical protein NCL1_58944 [Trichonephila clavipes]
MPRKRKFNLSQSSNKASAMKVAKLNETFPQAKLRRLEQGDHEATHRAAETLEQSQAWRQQNAQYLEIIYTILIVYYRKFVTMCYFFLENYLKNEWMNDTNIFILISL